MSPMGRRGERPALGVDDLSPSGLFRGLSWVT